MEQDQGTSLRKVSLTLTELKLQECLTRFKHKAPLTQVVDVMRICFYPSMSRQQVNRIVFLSLKKGRVARLCGEIVEI